MQTHRVEREEEVLHPDDPLAQFHSELESKAVSVFAFETPPAVQRAVEPLVEQVPPSVTPAAAVATGSATFVSTWAPIAIAAAAVLGFGVAWFTESAPPAEPPAAGVSVPAASADPLPAPVGEPSAVPAVTPDATPPTPAEVAPSPPATRPSSPRPSPAPPAEAPRRPMDAQPHADPLPRLVPDSPRMDAIEIVAAAPATLAGPPATSVDERARVQAVLDAYKSAYERLDVVSVATLWPGVDTQALRRAFSTLSRQRVFFDRCTIDVNGPEATAQCAGAIEYVRNVGDPTPQSRSTSWAFALNRTGSDWRIARIAAR